MRGLVVKTLYQLYAKLSPTWTPKTEQDAKRYFLLFMEMAGARMHAAEASALGRRTHRASVRLFLRGDAKDGAVTTDAVRGSMSFVTARTCGGFVESGRLEAGALTAEVSGAPAAIWVSSLDGKPVNESARLLLAHVTDAQGDGTAYADSSRRIVLAWGRGCLVEKGRATVRLAHQDDLRVWALDTSGRRRATMAVRREDAALVFDCTTDQGSPTTSLRAIDPAGKCIGYIGGRENAP